MKKPMSNRTKTYILMILPALILFIAFNTIPLITGAFYSLTNYRGYGSYDFVALRNFKDLFQDSRIGKSYLPPEYSRRTRSRLHFQLYFYLHYPYCGKGTRD